MVRYTEDAKLANNGLVELSEECQLAINGGCNDVTLGDVIWEGVRYIILGEDLYNALENYK